MARPEAKREEPAIQAPVIDYLCGLRKVGAEYVVVEAKLVSGRVEELKPDGKTESNPNGIAQPLQYAADALRLKLRKLIGEIP